MTARGRLCSRAACGAVITRILRLVEIGSGWRQVLHRRSFLTKSECFLPPRANRCLLHGIGEQTPYTASLVQRPLQGNQRAQDVQAAIAVGNCRPYCKAGIQGRWAQIPFPWGQYIAPRFANLMGCTHARGSLPHHRMPDHEMRRQEVAVS